MLSAQEWQSVSFDEVVKEFLCGEESRFDKYFTLSESNRSLVRQLIDKSDLSNESENALRRSLLASLRFGQSEVLAGDPNSVSTTDQRRTGL